MTRSHQRTVTRQLEFLAVVRLVLRRLGLRDFWLRASDLGVQGGKNPASVKLASAPNASSALLVLHAKKELRMPKKNYGDRCVEGVFFNSGAIRGLGMNGTTHQRRWGQVV